MDAQRPWHGKHCVKIHYPKNGATIHSFYGVFYLPDLEAPTRYVFSVYLRGARDGDKAWIWVDGWEKETGRLMGARHDRLFVTLTTEWKRCAVSGVYEPCTGRDRIKHFAIGVPRGNAKNASPGGEPVVWIDAVQIERGREPTRFGLE